MINEHDEIPVPPNAIGCLFLLAVLIGSAVISICGIWKLVELIGGLL